MVERLDSEGLWRVWRQMVRAMTVRGLVWDSVFGRSAWSQWGVDYVSGLRRNRSSQKVADIVRALNPADQRRLHAIAAINHRRLESVARWSGVAFLTVPASTALVLNQLAPEVLDRFDWDPGDVFFASVGVAWIGWIMMAAWRARQMVVVTELTMIELDLLPDADAAEGPDALVEAPVGA